MIIGAENVNIETEKKYLIKYPSRELLSRLEKSEIEQVYIASDGAYDGERVRRRAYDGKTVYTRTGKRRLSAMSAIEDEREITAEEFYLMRRCAEPGSSPIIKTRYVLPYRGYDFEIDVYGFWSDRAVMEVELPSEDSTFELPPEITVIRDVTDEPQYKNHALAYRVPTEVI